MKAHTFRPYQLAYLKATAEPRHRIVQVISKETPERTIMVRRTPGDATTMVEVAVADLLPCPQYRYAHFARVISGFKTFPDDMLRYDDAFVVDSGVGSEESPDGVLVYTCRSYKHRPWTDGRWKSFSCNVKHVLTQDLRDHR